MNTDASNKNRADGTGGAERQEGDALTHPLESADGGKAAEVRRRSALVNFFDRIASSAERELGSFRLELRGRRQLLVHGCRRIEEYTPSKISFAINGFSVTVSGRELLCTAYHGGCVCVEGAIAKISLSDGEDER